MTLARHVDSSVALYEALKTAAPGTVILLEPGDYGKLGLGRYNEVRTDFPGKVTVRSADPDNPAVFNSVSLREVQNLSFEDIVFHADGAETAFNVRDSSNIAIRNSLFTGDIIEDPTSSHDGLPSGRGISIRNTDGVVLEGNELTNSIYAATIRTSTDVVVRDNEFHNIRIDGLRFAAVEDVLIEDNHFHDFVTREGLGDHRDMIQFWTTDTVTPTKNVVIRNNILDSGTGTYTQSIFMRNELVDSKGAGHELFYRDILIENNVIYNAHLHGITVGETDGLTIINNTLLHNPDSGDRGGVSKPGIRTADTSMDVTIKNNIAHQVMEAPEGADHWDVRHNLVVQSDHPAEPNYVGDLFVDALAGGGDATLASLQGMPGGIVDQGGYGASLTRFDKKPDGLTALIRPDGESADGFTFDAGYSANSDGFLTTEDASFVWDMGDGTILEGARVQHSFAPGDYRVTLTVTDRDGNVDTVSTKVYMPEPLRLALTATSEGLVDASTFDATLPDDVEVVQDGDRFGARIGSDTGFGLERDAAPIHDLDAFTISFNLKALNGADSAGEVFRLHSSMLMRVSSDGSFSFDITNADGEKFKLRSDSTEVTDGDWHNVTLSYDKAHGSLLLSLNGTEIAETEASGSTKPLEHWGLSFGAVWNSTGFDGLIDGFEIHDTALRGSENNDDGRPGLVPDEPAEPMEPAPEEEAPDLPDEESENEVAPGEEASGGSSDPDPDTPELSEWAQAVWNTIISGEFENLPENPGSGEMPWLDSDKAIIMDLLADELPKLWESAQPLLDQKRDELRLAGKEEPLSGAGNPETSDGTPGQRKDLWSDLALLLDSETDILRFGDVDHGLTEFDDADLHSAIPSGQEDLGQTGDLLVEDLLL